MRFERFRTFHLSCLIKNDWWAGASPLFAVSKYQIPSCEELHRFSSQVPKNHTAQIVNPPLGWHRLHESIAVAEWDNKAVIWCQSPSPVRLQQKPGLGIFPLIPLESSNLYGQGRGDMVPLAMWEMPKMKSSP